MMCPAAMSQPTTWMAIQTRLEIAKELLKAGLISLESYKFELEKLADEVGIKTKRAMDREFDKIENSSFEKCNIMNYSKEDLS